MQQIRKEREYESEIHIDFQGIILKALPQAVASITLGHSARGGRGRVG
jgi:hypothetical protein